MGLFEKKTKENVETLPAKCTVSGADFEIAIEKRNGKLVMLEGKKSDGKSTYTAGASCAADKKQV